MKSLWDFGGFVRQLRFRMKYGELSRGPLGLLHVEVRGDRAKCDWLARPSDVWDSTLPRHHTEQLVSEQALRDAIGVSQLFFEALPEVQEAQFRTFRQSAREPPDLIITGTLRREAPPVFRVPSLAMRAKLHGFHFSLDEGVLVPLDGERDRHDAGY